MSLGETELTVEVKLMMMHIITAINIAGCFFVAYEITQDLPYKESNSLPF
jgi:hypothetical protein